MNNMTFRPSSRPAAVWIVGEFWLLTMVAALVLCGALVVALSLARGTEPAVTCTPPPAVNLTRI